MSIGKKLISGFFAVLVLLGGIAGFSMYQLSSIGATYSDLIDNQVTKVTTAKEMKFYGAEQIKYIRGYLVTGSESQIESYNKAKDAYNAESSKIAKMLDLEKAQALVKDLNKLNEDYAQVAVEAISFKKQNNTEGYIRLFAERGTPIANEFTMKANELEKMAQEVLAQENGATLQRVSHVKTLIVIVSIVAFLIGISIALSISRIISKPVSAMADAAKQIADGNLSTADIVVKNRDEIGEMAVSFNLMKHNLRNLISNVKEGSEHVAASAQQISATTEEIAGNSNSQANAAQTINELFKELSTAINSVAQSAEQAAELSNHTMDVAKEGGKVVQSSIDGMTAVNDQMSRLEEDSNKIGEIIEVIDDIAEQTNLLALNAAIEAARAGEQGRGFAVVADEVRKLAERSGEATKQITAIIKGMQENTHKSVIAVGEGVVSSQKTGEAFEHILRMVNDSANKVTEIAAASEQQAAQSSDVLNSIDSVSAAAEEAAASSEETAATAQSLAQLAEELNTSVSAFKVK